MNAKLLYLGNPTTNVEPVLQISNNDKAIITSIRIAAPTNNNGSYEIHHVAKGGTVANSTNSIAFSVAITSKHTAEFLVHPLPLSSGESLWLGGDNVCMAVYGITL